MSGRENARTHGGHRSRATPEARAARHASRAGATYASFLRSVASATGLPEAEAERCAIAVVATLEERLPMREVCDLEAQLPSRFDDVLGLQPIVRVPFMDKAQFCERVSARTGLTPAEAEGMARRVFAVLRSRISAGEAGHVGAQLPADLRELWCNTEGRTQWRA